MIKRFIENTVIKSAKAFPVIVITGPRQIGKSTLLDMLKKEKKIIANNHISLKDTVLRDFARNDPKGFLNTYKYPIIIDEIQEAPELFNEIKTIVDKKRLEDKNKSYGMYFLSGSQKFKLMKGVKESLAGMSAILDMMPISNNELKDGSHLPFLPTNNFKDKREQESLINIYQKIYRGFFPEVVNNKNIDSSIYYSSYIKTVIERDVNEIIKLDDTNKFRHFVETIAIRTGQELIINELAKDNDINNETVTR
jgi:predicted AAA+ superfamily ATPase